MHVLATAMGAAAAAVRWVCRKKKKRDHKKNNSMKKRDLNQTKNKRDLRNGEWLPVHHSTAADGGMSFSLEEIMAATRNFGETRVIGFGGQGKVFGGVIVDADGNNSTEVAIKRATPSSPRQNACEFGADVEALRKLRHRHLVPLVGSCSCSKEGETILVYRYMPRGTLREHLMTKPVMPWRRRLDACMGAARGLHCLHAAGVVHGAVKTSNVLFDESWVAKLSDYGLSRSATMESDVHSFGVVLFEVLTMARPGDMVGGLVDYAVACHRNGTLKDAIDPEIKDQVAQECLEKFAETAVECLAGNCIERPVIGDVLWNLELAVQLQLHA
jgi:serine/threonine protein kinase